MLWHVTALGGPALCGRRGLPHPPGERVEERRVARGTFQFRFGPWLSSETIGPSARLGLSNFSPSRAKISKVSARTRSTVRTGSPWCGRRPPSSAVWVAVTILVWTPIHFASATRDRRGTSPRCRCPLAHRRPPSSPTMTTSFPPGAGRHFAVGDEEQTTTRIVRDRREGGRAP